jgi:hypothetical protein
VVYCLDEVSEAARGVDREPARAAQIGEMIAVRRGSIAQWLSRF